MCVSGLVCHVRGRTYTEGETLVFLGFGAVLLGDYCPEFGDKPDMFHTPRINYIYILEDQQIHVGFVDVRGRVI